KPICPGGADDGRAGGDPDAGSDSHLDGADLPVSVPDGPCWPGGGNVGGVRGPVVHLPRCGGPSPLRRCLGAGICRLTTGDGRGDPLPGARAWRARVVEADAGGGAGPGAFDFRGPGADGVAVFAGAAPVAAGCVDALLWAGSPGNVRVCP